MVNLEPRLLNSKDKEWKEFLEMLPMKDVYFTPEYCSIWEEIYNMKSSCFIFGDHENFIFYPFLRRTINNLPFFKLVNNVKNTPVDIVTPEFYSGPLIKAEEKIKNLLLKKFLIEFHEWCIENNVVAEFARLHPFLKNHLLLPKENLTQVYENSVLIDLQQEKDVIWNNFEKRCRNAIKRAQREGIEVIRSENKNDINDFHRIYIALMNRTKTTERYLHPKDFFEKFFEVMKENSSLFIAKYEGETIAGALFLHGYGFMHYFRAASLENFQSKNPNNLILFEAINWAKENKFKIFVLGGGTKLNDNLFNFKKSFSKTTINVRSYRKIHMSPVYNLLCKKKIEYDRINKLKTDVNYFPLYRG